MHVIVLAWVAILMQIIFESAPFDAALIALAPLWQKADVHEIEEFLFKWEHILRNDEEMDADIRSYIKELGSLVDLLMQR